jgi:hypothetical protein
MDDATLHSWKEFMQSAGGKDLLARFIANETSYQAEGIKATTIEGKALAMAKIEAVYKLRTGILDIVAPKKPSKSA